MFTGIIEEMGKVQKISLAGSSGQIEVQAHRVLSGTRIGDSIAVNGVCLTVTAIRPDGFTADIMAETYRRSNLGQGKAHHVRAYRRNRSDPVLPQGRECRVGDDPDEIRDLTAHCGEGVCRYRRDQPDGCGGWEYGFPGVGDPAYGRGDNAS